VSSATHAPATFNAVTSGDTLAPRGKACASCGAPVEPGDHFCNACGTPQPRAAPEPSREGGTTDGARTKRYQCKTCGAETSVPLDTRSFTCPFCDSNYVVELPQAETGRQPPEFVIGFAVTPEQAREMFRHWLRQANWFRPGDLTRASVEDKLKGVYLPFWSFSMLAESDWTARIGEHWTRVETYTTTENGQTVTRTRTVTETEWWPLAGRHHEFYSGYLVSGSRGLKQADAERIKPFHLAALKRYEPSYLAGWLSEEYSVEREPALTVCKQEFSRREQNEVTAFMPGDTHSQVRLDTAFSQINSDLVLLPVYVLSYRYRQKLYRFLVNGQTGRETGDKPVSARRIMAVVFGVLALIGIIVLLVFLFSSR
jgi:hypothetical protein